VIASQENAAALQNRTNSAGAAGIVEKSVNDGLRIQTLLLRPANDNVKHTSVQSNGAHNIFAQARAIKSAVERLRYLLILDFFSSLGPR
jgi:hypothetical protein